MIIPWPSVTPHIRKRKKRKKKKEKRRKGKKKEKETQLTIPPKGTALCSPKNKKKTPDEPSKS